MAMRRQWGLALLALLLLGAAQPAATGAPALEATAAASPSAGTAAEPRFPWRKRVRRAARFADRRLGTVCFAVVGERSTLRGHCRNRGFDSASVIKAMFLVAYVRQRGVRHRRLRRSERRLLAPMIRRSDNVTATILRDRMGPGPIYRLAHAAGMRRFHLHPVWGLSRVTARDQARFAYRWRRLIPRRHRDYAFHLLASVVRSQRWGMPRVRLPRWRIYFKAGFVPGYGGWKINQTALFRRGARRRLAISVLTRGNPTLGYGAKTVQGVAARLLGHYNAITAR